MWEPVRRQLRDQATRFDFVVAQEHVESALGVSDVVEDVWPRVVLVGLAEVGVQLNAVKDHLATEE